MDGVPSYMWSSSVEGQGKGRKSRWGEREGGGGAKGLKRGKEGGGRGGEPRVKTKGSPLSFDESNFLPLAARVPV